MLTKSEVKYIQSLSHKKFRTESAQFVAEGPKILSELISRKPALLHRFFGTENWWQKQPDTFRNSYQRKFTAVADFELEKISNLQTPQEVLALVNMPVQKNVVENSHIILVLDGIQDPGNMGTIIRTAHWFGIQHIVCSEDCTDVFAPKTVQATMGSLFSTQVLYTPLETYLAQQKIPVYGALLNGAPLAKMQFSKPAILLIGNEGKGIRPEPMPFITNPVTIPGYSDAESLNAAIAAGILMYGMIGN